MPRAPERLAQMVLAWGEAELAVQTAIEAVSLGPFRKSSYELLMEAYTAGEDRARLCTSIIICTDS